MNLQKIVTLFLLAISFGSCNERDVILSNGTDESAGGGETYIIATPVATYYLEKTGGGLSSMIDKDGIDWIGFHNKAGSAHKGEFRGFPNAIHKQDGSYFHAMNAKTDPSTSKITIDSDNHVQIIFTSENNKWEGTWDFYLDRCDFTMSKISSGHKYWVQYEGVPGGEMDSSDFWYASIDTKKHRIVEPFEGDLPSPEWMAFGDTNSPRMLYMLHHEDDQHPDNYVYRTEMTVLGFGRNNEEQTTKHLSTIQTFSIGFIEAKEYSMVDQYIRKILE